MATAVVERLADYCWLVAKQKNYIYAFYESVTKYNLMNNKYETWRPFAITPIDPGPSRARVRPGENTTSLQLEVLTAEKNSLPHSAGPPEYRGARGSFPLLPPSLRPCVYLPYIVKRLNRNRKTRATHNTTGSVANNLFCRLLPTNFYSMQIPTWNRRSPITAPITLRGFTALD